MPPAVLGLILIVRLYDNAGFVPVGATSASRIAADIFHAAGIETAWVFCGPPGSTASTNPPACADTPGPSTVMIRITVGPLARGIRTTDPLGSAYVDTVANGGTLATVHLDRVIECADAAGIDATTLAGWTIAHELGHLLLGTVAHSPQGLMRVRWSTATLTHPLGDHWRFSADEANRLRQNLIVRSQQGETRAVASVGGGSGR